VRFLLNRDIEYCYLIYEDNILKRIVDALQELRQQETPALVY
jgi:hypothetical protein